MNQLSLNQLRKLFSVYTPLTSNKRLYDKFVEITGQTHFEIESIRKVYNNKIFKGFLNETVIKNSFIKKHCINMEDTVTIFELNSGNSRADICMINGKSYVFEIKTEYDTTARLDKQLSDYKKLFDYLYVIVSNTKLSQIKKEIGNEVGIVSYTTNSEYEIVFDKIRKPKLNKNIDPFSQLNDLTLKQLRMIYSSKESKENIIKSIMNKYSKKEINNLYKKHIKEKYREKWDFLTNNINEIVPLDYQWFFKNNIPIKIVYK